MKNVRKAELDGLRGIGSIIIAFFVHFQVLENGSFPFSNIFPYLSYRGHYFTEVFFLISGYCMTLNYQDYIINCDCSLSEYFVKRIKKFCFPNVFTTLLCALFCLAFFLKTGTSIFYKHDDFAHLLLDLLLIQNIVTPGEESFNAVTWFLSVLLFINLIYFFTARKVKDKNKLYYAFTSYAILAIAVLINGWSIPLFHRNMARGVLSFFTGMVIANLSENISCELKKKIGFCAGGAY